MLITKRVTSQRRAKTGAQVWRTQKVKVSEGDLLHLHLQGDRVVKALDWKIPGLATHQILSLYPCCPEESLINASLNCAIGISSLSGLSQTYKRWWSNRYVPCKKKLAMNIMNTFINDIIERIATKASHLARHNSTPMKCGAAPIWWIFQACIQQRDQGRD